MKKLSRVGLLLEVIVDLTRTNSRNFCEVSRCRARGDFSSITCDFFVGIVLLRHVTHLNNFT